MYNSHTFDITCTVVITIQLFYVEMGSSLQYVFSDLFNMQCFFVFRMEKQDRTDEGSVDIYLSMTLVPNFTIGLI